MQGKPGVHACSRLQQHQERGGTDARTHMHDILLVRIVEQIARCNIALLGCCCFFCLFFGDVPVGNVPLEPALIGGVITLTYGFIFSAICSPAPAHSPGIHIHTKTSLARARGDNILGAMDCVPRIGAHVCRGLMNETSIAIRCLCRAGQC